MAVKPIAPLMVVVGLATGQTAYATSTLLFTGGEFEIQVVASNTANKITDFRLYDRDGLVRSAREKDFEVALYDADEQTLRVEVPVKGKTPKLVVDVRGKSATLYYGTRRVRLKGDWVR